ncbi:MAG: dynamin family protein [Thermodesulfobacteriota bacterium]
MELQTHPSYPAQSNGRSILERVRETSLRFNLHSLARQIEACQSLFGQEKVIDVAILGQFKAGKSSFINSLIEQDVLPVGVTPVTTVVTRLRYGRDPRAAVTHFDGRRVEMDLTGIGKFISEEKNPANEKQVEVVDVELPVLKRYTGLRLVDTPGLGSVFRYNTDTSEEWLPEVGAAIVAVSADRPLSENDLNLIRELARHTPRIVILLTKVDLLSQEQHEEVIRFLKKALRRGANLQLPVYSYSTRANTDLLKARIDNLLAGLSSNRDAEFRNILLHKLTSLTKSCLGYLELALKTSLKADEERDSLKRLILTEKLDSDLIRSEIFSAARDNMLQTRTLIAARLETKRREFTIRLMTRLKEEMRAWKGNLWRLTRQYEQWLEENLSKELNDLSRGEHRHFFGTLKRAHMSISRYLELFRNLLDRNIESVLGVKLSSPSWDLDVPEPSHPDVAFTRVFDFHFDLLWFLIPMFVFRAAFERHFLDLIPRIAQTHLSRLAYQWEVRINRAIEKVRDQAVDYVQKELSTIDAILSQSVERSTEIRSTIKGLREGLQTLEHNGE